MLREQVKIAPDRMLDVVLEHGDDQFVLALEVRIKRAAREARRSRDRLDAGAANSLVFEDLRSCLEQLFAGVVSCRSGPNP